jgi:alpha-1,6-rhamnosyltransferase
MSKLVSVVVLSYNHADFIANTIESINTQNYENVEIVVVDDGSTDNSVVVLKELQKRINFKLLQKINGGVVSAINLGIKVVSGEYTIFHACDDISLPDRVTQQIEVFLKFPDAAFVSSNINLVNEDGIHQKELHKRGSSKKITLDDALLGANITSVGCIYRTSCLKKIILNEDYIAEDPQIHFLLLKINSYAIVDYSAPVLNYYLRAGSQSGTKMPKLLLQNLELLKEYRQRKVFKKAYRQVQVSFLSNLSENVKKDAIAYLLKNPVLIKAKGIQRVLVKLCLPSRFHKKFKSGRC